MEKTLQTKLATSLLLLRVGMWKKYTYGAILVLHAGSTFSSFAKYMDPFNNLLFFASWPMLAACIALFLLRDYDTYSVAN